MTNIADTTRDIFQVSNNYIGSVLQQGQTIYDWMYNSDVRELSHLVMNSLSKLSNSAVVVNGEEIAFYITQLGTPANDVILNAGSAIVNGRVVTAPSDFNYSDEEVNNIAIGSVTSIVEVVAGSTYRLYDAEKLWTTNHNLVGCRIVFTSGALDGDGFTIVSLIGQGVTVNGDLSTLAEDDTYIIAPPAFATPSASETKTLTLVTWVEDVSENEDADLTDPVFQDSPIHKRQLRWCVHNNWSGTQSTDPTTGFCTLDLGTVTRSAGDATISTEDIAFTANKVNECVTSYDLLVETTEDADEALDRLLVHNLHDYTMSRSAPLFFSIVDEDITFSDAVFSAFNMEDKVSLKNQAEITGTTVTNATTAQSLLVMTPNVDDDEVTVTQTTSTNIPQNSLCLLGVVADTVAPYEILRSNPMGEHVWSRGFDWYIAYNPVVQTTVYPGEFYRWGQLYQLPDQYTFDHTNNVNWENTTLPSGTGWVFLYVKPTSTTRRDLTPFLSETAPKWNGEHASLKAQCIGVVYWNSFTPTNAQWRYGSTITYKNTILRSDTASHGSFQDISSEFPPCVTSCSIVAKNIDATVVTTLSFIVAPTSTTTDTYSFSHTIPAGHTGPVQINIPLSNYVGYLLGILSASDAVGLYIGTVQWNDTHTPSKLGWR